MHAWGSTIECQRQHPARRLDIPCSSNLATFDLETEVFLNILKNCVEYVQVRAWNPPPRARVLVHVRAARGWRHTNGRGCHIPAWLQTGRPASQAAGTCVCALHLLHPGLPLTWPSPTHASTHAWKSAGPPWCART